MSKWIIKDWMGNIVDLGKEKYTDFADARGAITEFAHELTETAIDNGKYERDSQEHEESMDGIEEDLYAVYVDDNGKEIEGDYTI